jgi:hypothetical protein
MVNQGIASCQIELKPVKRGQPVADKPKSAGNAPDLSSRAKRRSR